MWELRKGGLREKRQGRSFYFMFNKKPIFMSEVLQSCCQEEKKPKKTPSKLNFFLLHGRVALKGSGA